jgi:hypothetical protein
MKYLKNMTPSLSPMTYALLVTLVMGALVQGCARGSGGDGADGENGEDPSGGRSSGGGAPGSGGQGRAGEGGGGEKEEDPIYLFNIGLSDIDGNFTNYALLRNELNLEISADDLTKEKAYPFPGYSGIAVIDGHVIVGESSRPFAKKFDVSDDFVWTQVGNDLNFSDYVNNDTDGLNFYFQAIRGTDMYLFFGADRSSRKLWSVADWKLKDEYTDTELPNRAGWTLGSTGNRTSMRDWQGPIFQSFSLWNDETGIGADESYIAVYDQETHAEKSVIDVPCPGLQQQTIDEEGRVYFSTTFNTPVLGLYGEQPFSCVVRLNSDGTLDEEFGTNDMSAWTGGFYGVNFRYLKGGKAVANVLHHNRLGDVDWEGDVDPEVVVQIEGEWTDAGFTPQDATLWDLEVIDLEAGTSKKITGFEEGHDDGSYSIFFQVEGRIFMSFQIDAFGDPRNAMYELDVETAKLKYLGMIDGELGNIERVR